MPSKPPVAGQLGADAIPSPSHKIALGASIQQLLPTASLANGSWKQACDAYRRSLNLNAPVAQAASFKSYGVLHLVVADILLERADEMEAQGGAQRIVHIAGAAGLLAVYSPTQRIVQVRLQPTATAQLTLRVMPASASLLEGDAAKGFQAVPLAALMWYFGQNAAQAFSYMPDVQQQILRIRRFPTLEPSSLLLRHLRLLHVLSQGSYRFDTLLPMLSDEQRTSVCPDLVAFYLTGALSLKTT